MLFLLFHIAKLRIQVDYKNTSDQFIVKDKKYGLQYCHMYSKRAVMMRDRLVLVALPITSFNALYHLHLVTRIFLQFTYFSKNIKSKWGVGIPIITRIIDSESGDHEQMNEHSECVLIGSSYKEMSLRSSVSTHTYKKYVLSSRDFHLMILTTGFRLGHRRHKGWVQSLCISNSIRKFCIKGTVDKIA